MRILFILKRNECYGFTTYTRRSSGLWNSTHFIVQILNKWWIKAGIVEVTDNNDIDRVVTEINPDIVVIEALWVVPEKFDILKRLHPKVSWFVHMHSQIPFLSYEGIAIEWLKGYVKRGLSIIANSQESYDAFVTFLPASNVLYIPNVYEEPEPPFKIHMQKQETDHVHIGCFGAIRPLKNQLIQAMAARKFAQELGKELSFYVNATRVETGGEPILKNLRALLGISLVEVKWCEPLEFLALLDRLEIGMQVSLTETFNVVSANYVTVGLPMVVGPEVRWASKICHADPADINDIVKVMHRVYQNPLIVWWNKRLLQWNSVRARMDWVTFAISGKAR